MLLATWIFVCFFKRFRSFDSENLGSTGQRAAKLQAIKVWEWCDPGRSRMRADRFEWGQGRMADFFLRPPTLTDSNFVALWPKDPIFTALKDLNLLKKSVNIEEAGSLLKICLLKWPHFHKAYLVTERKLYVRSWIFWILKACTFILRRSCWWLLQLYLKSSQCTV